MIRRSDNDNWAVPGGAIDLGESLTQAAIRETNEETGIDCILYTSDGEARQEFSILLTARALAGKPTPSDESTEVRWLDRDELNLNDMDRSMRLRLEHYFIGSGTPHLG